MQGRDLYKNNIQQLLENAVGDNHSAFCTSLDAQDEQVVEGLIIDDEQQDFPGVYIVTFELPEQLLPGDYEYNVQLGGQRLPTPNLVRVNPCSNLLAIDLEKIPSYGSH